MELFAPSLDAHIARKYGISSLDQKLQNKTTLQAELGWPKEPKRPMICLPAGMTDALGGALLQEMLPGIVSMQLEILVLGKGSSAYGTLFTKLAKEQQHRIHIVADEEIPLRKMYAAADMALFLRDPTDMPELAHCLQYGVVAVSAPSATLEDYNPVQETGNAFIFDTQTKWHAFASLVRALETYKFPFDWRTIQRHCMETAERKQ